MASAAASGRTPVAQASISNRQDALAFQAAMQILGANFFGQLRAKFLGLDQHLHQAALGRFADAARPVPGAL